MHVAARFKPASIEVDVYLIDLKFQAPKSYLNAPRQSEESL